MFPEGVLWLNLRMHVAVARVSLYLPGNRDLKGKRRIVKSLCARVRNRFEVAVAEVGGNDMLQAADIGIAAVSNSRRHAGQAVDAVLAYIEGHAGDYEVMEVERESF